MVLHIVSGQLQHENESECRLRSRIGMFEACSGLYRKTGVIHFVSVAYPKEYPISGTGLAFGSEGAAGRVNIQECFASVPHVSSCVPQKMCVFFLIFLYDL